MPRPRHRQRAAHRWAAGDPLNANIAVPVPAAKLFGQVDSPGRDALSRALEAFDVPEPSAWQLDPRVVVCGDAVRV